MAEAYISNSPYNYCLDNPILLIDPDGMASKYNWDTERYEDEEGNEVTWDQVQMEYGIGKYKPKEEENDDEENSSSTMLTGDTKGLWNGLKTHLAKDASYWAENVYAEEEVLKGSNVYEYNQWEGTYNHIYYKSKSVDLIDYFNTNKPVSGWVTIGGTPAFLFYCPGKTSTIISYHDKTYIGSWGYGMEGHGVIYYNSRGQELAFLVFKNADDRNLIYKRFYEDVYNKTIKELRAKKSYN